jgi:hypothetical protein
VFLDGDAGVELGGSLVSVDMVIATDLSREYLAETLDRFRTHLPGPFDTAYNEQAMGQLVPVVHEM